MASGTEETMTNETQTIEELRADLDRLRTDCDEYRRKCGDVYLWQLEIADILKLPSFTEPEQILGEIRRLKTHNDFWRDVAYRHLANVALYLGLPDPENAPEHLVLRTVRDVVAKLKAVQSEVK